MIASRFGNGIELLPVAWQHAFGHMECDMDTKDHFHVACRNSAQQPAVQDDCETHDDLIDNMIVTTDSQWIETTDGDLHTLSSSKDFFDEVSVVRQQDERDWSNMIMTGTVIKSLN